MAHCFANCGRGCCLPNKCVASVFWLGIISVVRSFCIVELLGRDLTVCIGFGLQFNFALHYREETISRVFICQVLMQDQSAACPLVLGDWRRQISSTEAMDSVVSEGYPRIYSILIYMEAGYHTNGINLMIMNWRLSTSFWSDSNFVAGQRALKISYGPSSSLHNR